MLFSVEQAFVGRDEKRAPLKTFAWEATPEAATRRTQCLTFVIVMQQQQKKVQKSMMLLHSCCYVKSKPVVFCRF